MSISAPAEAIPGATVRANVVYPDCDGLPLSNNTEHLYWILWLKDGFDAFFNSWDDVFVAADLLWYPVEGNPGIRVAPDVMVIFGRPKGHRGSYRQFDEAGVPVHVVIEVVSPGNTRREMARKFEFFSQHGAEEYYIYDCEHGELDGWVRKDGVLAKIGSMRGWVSPRMGLKFDLDANGRLQIILPDGSLMESHEEVIARAERERKQADRERQRADIERQRAENEKLMAEQERKRAERLAAKLREAGIDPED